jgi:hypothetical protein
MKSIDFQGFPGKSGSSRKSLEEFAEFVFLCFTNRFLVAIIHILRGDESQREERA